MKPARVKQPQDLYRNPLEILASGVASAENRMRILRRLGVAMAAAALVFSRDSLAVGREKTIVVIGDSIAQGYGVSAEEAFPAVAEKLLRKRGFNARIVNGGISGSVTAGADARVRWYLKIKPDVVLLELGGNDGLKGASTKAIKQNLGKAIDLAKANGAIPVLAGMKMFPNLGPEYARSFEEAFAELAREKKTAFIPFLLEGVAANPKLNIADGKHPNAEGHRKIAETVAKALEPLL